MIISACEQKSEFHEAKKLIFSEIIVVSVVYVGSYEVDR